MGRSSKFTFPLPSRNKQRSAPVSPLPPDTPRSKAQQILGNGALNIDGGSNWDGASNSGISIAVSESTVRSHHPTEKTLSAITEVPAKSASQWEADSETVPAYLKVGGSRPGTGTRSHNGIDTYDPSDYSGLRARRQSASTIMSYYDKSRVPLSISQQTSSSAMAKGLPTKASTLLDIDGTMSPPKQKKRPSRLDFSYLLPRGRPSTSHSQNSMLSPEPAKSSPSVMTLSPMSSRATLASAASRKSTREKLQEFASRASRKQIVPESPVIPNHMANSADLHNLYEHYEQMSFRQVMGPDFDMEAATGLEVVKESPAENPVQAIPQPPSPTSEPQFDPTKVLSPSRVAIMPDADYATSVSSRHTRTSKASKRTTQSIFDSDLHQNSILSLSSDSEDDAYLDQRSQRDTAIERGRGLFREEGYLTPLSEKRRSVASKSSAGSGKRASFAPKSTYLTIPSASTPPRVPDISKRSSSLSHSTSPTPSSSVQSSRMSTLSTSSAGSATQPPILEARVVTITPAHTQDTSSLGQLDTHTLARTDSVRSIDQPTPPLSPNSVEFYVRPPSVPSVTNSRLIMAVTKQEEMLLSALRMKRARMRGNALSELEEEEEAFGETLSRQSSVRTRDTAYMAPVRAIQKSGSKSSIGTVTPEKGSTIHPRSLSRTPKSLSRSQSRTGPWSDTEESHDVTLGGKFAPADAPQDRIVFYLDQGVGQAEDEEEPSPDLSDFMDYDDGSEDSHSLRETDNLRRDNDKPPATPKDAVPSTASLDSKEQDGTDELCLAGEEDVGGLSVPRPDSPLSPTLPLSFPIPRSMRKPLRLSAVGGVVTGMEAPWWGDDG